MNNVSVLSELFVQLEFLFRNYNSLISKENNLMFEEGQEEISESANSIKVMIMVIKQEIQKLKAIKKRELELEKSKNLSKKYDDRIIDLNNVLINGIQNLKRGTNILKMSSTNKNVVQSNFQPRDLINFTTRINKTFSAPEGLGSFLPSGYLTPYPQEEVEMKSSFLKFNFDESSRLKLPIITPDSKEIKKGSILEIKYPLNDKDVFFKYTLSENKIPSFFSGEIYNPTNPLIISQNMTIKVCSCKYGYMDSQVKTMAYETTGEEANDSMISKFGGKFAEGAERPITKINYETRGFELTKVLFDDDSSSHYTPGSMYQISNYRPERTNQENDDDIW